MKKLTYLFLALVSTTFLFVGATHAAEKFDALGKHNGDSPSDTVMDGPGMPCVPVEEN